MNHSLIPTRAIVQVQGAKHWDRDGCGLFFAQVAKGANLKTAVEIVAL